VRSILSLVVVDLDKRVYVISYELVDGWVGDQEPQLLLHSTGGDSKMSKDARGH
jgi:hypothetical protein